jgi:hypothetical protein
MYTRDMIDLKNVFSIKLDNKVFCKTALVSLRIVLST